jgi:hypothetical protein
LFIFSTLFLPPGTVLALFRIDKKTEEDIRSIQKEEDGNEEVSWFDDGFRFGAVEKEEDENEEVSGFDDGLGLVLLTGVAFTADSNTVTVTANVVATCRLNWATPTLGFGALDPGAGGDVNASTSTTS